MLVFFGIICTIIGLVSLIIFIALNSFLNLIVSIIFLGISLFLFIINKIKIINIEEQKQITAFKNIKNEEIKVLKQEIEIQTMKNQLNNLKIKNCPYCGSKLENDKCSSCGAKLEN